MRPDDQMDKGSDTHCLTRNAESSRIQSRWVWTSDGRGAKGLAEEGEPCKPWHTGSTPTLPRTHRQGWAGQWPVNELLLWTKETVLEPASPSKAEVPTRAG